MNTQCIYGCYVRPFFLSRFQFVKNYFFSQVHSAVLPTFHRRCYWLLQNPDIVLVHYLNVPYPDDRTQHNKLIIAPSLLFNDKKEWTKEELLNQLKPMCRNTFMRINSRIFFNKIIFYIQFSMKMMLKCLVILTR